MNASGKQVANDLVLGPAFRNSLHSQCVVSWLSFTPMRLERLPQVSSMKQSTSYSIGVRMPAV